MLMRDRNCGIGPLPPLLLPNTSLALIRTSRTGKGNREYSKRRPVSSIQALLLFSLPPVCHRVHSIVTLSVPHARADAFEVYKNLTGGVKDEDVGLLKISLEQYEKLESLYFNIGGVSVCSTH